MPFGSGVKLYGTSKSGSTVLLDLTLDSESGIVTLLRVRKARLRPSQPIQLLVPACDGSQILSVGNAGEMLLWKARGFRDRTAIVEVVAAYRTSISYAATHAALSPNGQLAIVASSTDIQLFARRDAKLEPLERSKPSMPASSDIVTIALLGSIARHNYLLVVDRSGVVRVWLIPEQDSLSLVHTSTSTTDRASLASVTTAHVGRDVIQVAILSLAGRLITINVYLGEKHISSRQESDVQTIEQDARHICCSTTHHIATGSDAKADQ